MLISGFEPLSHAQHASGRDDPAFERVARWQAVLRVPGLVLVLSPSRLHQAQGGV